MSGEAYVPIDPASLHEVCNDAGWLVERMGELDRLLHACDTIDERRMYWFDRIDEQIVLMLAAGQDFDALTHGCWAYEWAKMYGTPAQLHIATARLAYVHTRLGEYHESTIALLDILPVAPRFGPVVDAFTHQLAGLDDYAQHDYEGARAHFAYALQWRELGGEDLATRHSRVALAAAVRHLAERAA